MGRTLLFSFTLLFCLISHATTINKNKLVKIKHSIAKIKTEIASDQKLKKSSQKKLKSTELQTTATQRKLKKTSNELIKQLSRLQHIHKQMAKDHTLIASQQKAIAQTIRAAYVLGPPPLVELLLDNKQAETAARMRMYYDYLAGLRAKSISKLDHSLSSLKQLDKKHIKHTQKLQHLKQKQLQQQQQLKQLQHSRKATVNAINKRIQSKHHRLQTLLYNERVFERTLRALKKKKSLYKGNFARLKGKLSWPTPGKIINNFGTRMNSGEPTWSGVLILAKEGQKVHAVAPGQVVFANWLPGYGLILIIDHGRGFMSLYGRNHQLRKKEGDFVSKGEVIANAGKSGGYSRSSLYFAIRRNAKPLSPIHWCH